MSIFTITSDSLISGTEYDGVIDLDYYLPEGDYEILEFITSNRFPNILAGNQFSTVGGTDFGIAEGLYNGSELATALQSAFDVNLWPIAGGTVSYDIVTNLLTVTYNDSTLDNDWLVIRSKRMSVVLGLELDIQQNGGLPIAHPVTYSGFIDVSPVKIIYMNISESVSPSLYDSRHTGQDIVITPNFKDDQLVYRRVDQGYIQILKFPRTIKRMTFRFNDNYGLPLSQSPIDWYMLVKHRTT